MVHQDDITLRGMRIDRLTQRDTVATVVDAMHEGRGGWVTTPNTDHLRRFTRDPGVRHLLSEADIAVPDGMPIVWASRLQGTPLPERVAGSDLIWSLTEAAAAEGRSVFFLGGDEGVAEKAGRQFADRYPGLRIAGTLCPPLGFEDDPAELRRIDEALVAARPDIVYVGLGFPKQERLIAHLRPLLPRTWFLGIGISMSFVTGDVPRAPRWTRLAGLEWLHRLTTDPRRLFGRYVRHGIPFTVGLLARAMASRLRLVGR